MAKLIKTTGSIKNVFPKDKKRGFTLDELYGLIGCDLIEIINRNGVVYVVDEEALLKENPIINQKASLLMAQTIFGNVIACEPSEIK